MKMMKMKNKLTQALDWLRMKEPKNLSYNQLVSWEKEQKDKRPIMYCIKYTIMSEIYDYIFMRKSIMRDIVRAIKYRTTYKYNILHTGLKPDYYDLDTRILHGVFNQLVDFVECEKAWLNVVWRKDASKQSLFKKFRSPENGIEYLQWEIDTADVEGQKEGAEEILALYKWWKEIYLTRQDASDASGWSAYCDVRHSQGYDDHEVRTEEQKAEVQSILTRLFEIERAYRQEEEDMLIRLIKIRKYLWT